MKKFSIELNMESMFSDVIVTAYEGGSSYWAYTRDKLPSYPDRPDLAPSERLVKKLIEDPEYSLDVYDVETDEKLGSLTQAGMIKAFQLAADLSPQSLSSLFTGEYDATDADVLFQYAVMGELVYG